MSAPTTAADPTAVVGRRIVAYVIDQIMVWAIVIVLALVLAEDTSPNDDSFDFVIEGGNAVVLYLVPLVYLLMTQVLQQGLTGATPGKLIAAVRCVKADGSDPGLLRALLRWILLVIDAGLCYIPGLVLVLATKRHQRLGDLAASTFVVRADAVGRPVDAPTDAQASDWTDPQWGAQPVATGDQWGAWASSPAPGAGQVPQGGDQGASWGQQPEQQSPTAPAWGQPAEQQAPATPAWGQPAEEQAPATPAWGQPAEEQAPATPAWGQPAEQQTPTAPTWGRPAEEQAPATSAWAQPAEQARAEPERAQPAASEPAASDETWIPSAGQGAAAADEATREHTAATGAASADSAAPTYAPQWDADRQAYIQWDPSGRRWMQWDQANQRWFPIS